MKTRYIPQNRAKVVQQLIDATEALLKAHGQLMPGLRHIAVEDYENINVAPILARQAIARARLEINQILTEGKQ